MLDSGDNKEVAMRVILSRILFGVSILSLAACLVLGVDAMSLS